MKNTNSIKVSEENWKNLMRIKIDKSLPSINEVISYLINLKGGIENE